MSETLPTLSDDAWALLPEGGEEHAAARTFYDRADEPQRE